MPKKQILLSAPITLSTITTGLDEIQTVTTKIARKVKRAFTLLEVMVAIVILTLASGVIGLKMHGAVQKKRFQSDLDRFRARMLVSQKIAVSTEADWSVVIRKIGGQWVLASSCDEPNAKKMPLLRLNFTSIHFNQSPADELTFNFFSSGKVLPEGTFAFSFKSEKAEVLLTDLFKSEEGTKDGPIHPNDKLK